MSGAVLPMWVFVAVAAIIATGGFALAQILPGAGMTFVAMAATLWVAFVARRGASGGARHD